MSSALQRYRHTSVRRTADATDVDLTYLVGVARARRERQAFTNAGLRIGQSDTVHAVRFREDSLGLNRAAPACHTGHSRPDGSDDLHPVTDQEVNCRACLSRPIARDEGQPYAPMSGQYALWGEDDGVPEPASYPPE